MTPSPDRHEKLERFVAEAVRGLPPRRAPRSLETRVLAEIERRAALPWWQQSFVHWPIAARAGFLVVCLGIVKLLIMGAIWVMAGFDSVDFQSAFATRFAWVESGFALVRSLTDSMEIVIRHIPALWLYGGLTFFATLYVALFGLGAAAYRTLYANR